MLARDPRPRCSGEEHPVPHESRADFLDELIGIGAGMFMRAIRGLLGEMGNSRQSRRVSRDLPYPDQ